MISRATPGFRAQTLQVDVSSAAGLGEPAHTVVTVFLPKADAMPIRPVVAFGIPGAGLNRSYFSVDLPGMSGGGQAGWHCRSGWIFVAVDSLGVGEASLPDPTKLTLRRMAAVNHQTVEQILNLLARGALAEGFPAVVDPLVLGLGHSMGGGLTIAQQAYHDSFHGIGTLGFSAVWTTSRGMPGAPPARPPFLPRDTALDDAMSHESRCSAAANTTLMRLQADHGNYPTKSSPAGWNDHFDDVPLEVREWDLSTDRERPPWRSTTMPNTVFWMLSPGSLGPEAASIVVPVLSTFGERDVSEDPRLEHKAFRHAVDFSSFICPRMGHMHNFASTREVLWSRIHHWAAHVSDLRERLPRDWPAELFSDSY